MIPSGAADVAEPKGVAVALDLADELRVVGSHAGEDGVDVVDHEREMAKAWDVGRQVAVGGRPRRRVELHQLQPSVAVRGGQHRELHPDAVEPDDAIDPAVLDLSLPARLKAEIEEEGPRGGEVVDHDAHVVHPLDRHALDGSEAMTRRRATRAGAQSAPQVARSYGVPLGSRPSRVDGEAGWMALRETFDEVPELYDRVRPRYPEAVFDDLAALVELRSGSRILEIGCGTGQATASLGRRGYEVVAVELGVGLAAVARRKLAGFSSVQVVTAAFEEWPLPAEPFDAVVAATSFHWIDPAVRLEKPADALRPGGALAVISTHHVAGGDTRFFDTVQGCYERWMPDTPPGLTLPAAGEVPIWNEAIESSDRFERMAFRRYEWELTYATQDYLDLVMSYSGHRALDAQARESLLGCIAQLIDSGFGGNVTKRYMTELALAYTSCETRR